MTHHTPGPWHTDSIDQVRTKQGLVISRCERKERHEYMDSKEQHANAVLIATAPDLLRALQACVNYMTDPAQFHETEREKILDFADLILAKAEGR